MTELLFGRNAIREALVAGRRRFFRLILADRLDAAPVVSEIQALARKANLPVERMIRKRMDKLAHNHQGIMLEAAPYPYADLGDLLEAADASGEEPFFLALDHIEDPHNLGAMIRTAELVGAHGIILPNQGQADVTPAVVKASVGASEHLQVAKIANLAQALNHLKKKGIWAVGVQHGTDSKCFHEADLKGPIVLVIGSEGQGMSRIVKETCDFLIEIPMRGHIESLNASVASALVLYETWRARGFQGRN
ncbi:MAG: 23S rRNA (guanosine(2251)-2'-O)-methyltransferase RlmB [Puniceicoccaceae bacterium]